MGDRKRFAWPRNASSGKDLQSYRPPTLPPGFKDGSLVPTNAKVPSSITQTPPTTQTGGCSRLLVLALLNVALSRSHSVNHPLFSGQGHIFSTASKIKKDSIQLETTPSLFGMSQFHTLSNFKSLSCKSGIARSQIKIPLLQDEPTGLSLHRPSRTPRGSTNLELKCNPRDLGAVRSLDELHHIFKV